MAATARAAAPATPAVEERSRMPVSRPGDASEREAQALARRIAPAMARAQGRSALLPATPAAVQAAPQARAGGGQPLPAGVRAAVEPRLGASLGGVRVHTDADAAARAAAIGARAFTLGADIYFGAGQYQPDTPAGRELIAHELVHTVQQGATVQRSAIDPVTEQVRPHVQRGALDWARDAGEWLGDKASAGIEAVKAEAREFFAARAASLPGYRLFRLATGRDPITGETVTASGAEVLRAIVGIVPLGEAVVKALDNHDIFDRGAAFIAQQAGALFDLASGIIGDVKAFIGRLGVSDALRLGELWDEARALVSTSISSVINFLGNLVSDFAALVKDAILKPLGAWAAANVPHWDLLTGVLGLNPVSDEGTSPGEQLIGAFMALIGQQEVWDNIRKSGAIGRAWAWFQGALGGAKALVTSIPGRVKGIFTGLTISDLLTIPAVFGRIVGTFASFVADFTRWGLGTVLSLLEIILSVVAPAALPYIKKAGGAFATILRNPIGFVGNLVAAGKQGFLAFAGNFLTHLKAGLIGWLTGSLGGAGVYIPQGFSARELLKFVASVLGLTWAQLRVRLVAAVGETAVVAMEGGFALVKTLVTEGPAAAWQQIIEAVGNLKAMAIDAVMDFVKSKIITVAITRLVMMLNPAGAFIQALLAIWNTIRFFMERLAQIKAVAMRFIDSIAAIANGALGAAAARVEQTMAGMLVLVISFLARQANLGNVGQAVTGFIRRLRAPIERALDRVIAFVVAQARRLGRFVAQAGVPNDPAKRLQLAARDAVRLARPLRGRATEPLLKGALQLLQTRYALTRLTVRRQGQAWVAHLVINPDATPVLDDGSATAVPAKPTKPGATSGPATPAPAGSVPSGPNIAPMLGKLRQVQVMYQDWAAKGTAPTAPKMLALVGTTLAEGEQLHKDREAGVTPLDARFAAFGKTLRSIQTLDPGYTLYSIGNMEITLKNAKGQMKLHTISYNLPGSVRKMASGPVFDGLVNEMQIELRNQQDGVNSMMIDYWLSRRPAFNVKFQRPEGEAAMREEFGRRSQLAGTGMAAPHNPDQILGGEIDPTGGPVRGLINQSLGSQNKTRAKELDNHVRATYPGPEQMTLQMNVKLKVEA